ncbi:MAG: hypothetical protein GPJ52_04530 [Candidatus Heimdallarchaeota archaeon]|nr:hypothetical protein [Candidatus Heimdallarchaeota archaeon]
MSENAALAISITALILSFFTALVSYIISWHNHRKSFDPIIVIDAREDEEKKRLKFFLKNVGRGTAFDIVVDVFIKDNNKYSKERIARFDVMEVENQSIIPMHIIDQYMSKDDDYLLVISYENESRRKLGIYYTSFAFFEFVRISKIKFKQYLRRWSNGYKRRNKKNIN